MKKLDDTDILIAIFCFAVVLVLGLVANIPE
jgi:hypothetical protein